MPTTPKGFPYPAPTDPVANGAANIQALATQIDTYLGAGMPVVPKILRGRVNGSGGIEAGSGFTITKGATGLYTVNFPSFGFTGIPAIVICLFFGGQGSFHTPCMTAVNAQYFQFVILNASNAPQDCGFHFHAIEC